MDSQELANICAEVIYRQKGEEIVLLNIAELSDVADYFVIATATSPVHIKAIANEIEHSLRKAGVRVHHIEGLSALKWVVLDYLDVIVHIFLPQTREFYSLEDYWADAPQEELYAE